MNEIVTPEKPMKQSCFTKSLTFTVVCYKTIAENNNFAKPTDSVSIKPSFLLEIAVDSSENHTLLSWEKKGDIG